MNPTKIDKLDDEQLRLCGEIIQELGLVIYRRALQRALTELNELTERTNERMTAKAKRCEGPELADQYKGAEDS